MRRNIDGQTAFAYTRKRLGVFVGKLRNRGGFLPPERILCEEIGVSRDTLKSVVDSFVKEGLVEVRPRKGNYVLKAKPSLDFRVGLIWGVGEMPFLGASAMAVITGAFEYFETFQLFGMHQMHFDEPEDVFELAVQYALDGILWINPAPNCHSVFERLLGSSIPTMAAIPSFAGVKLPGNYTGLDYEGGGRAKAAHLLSRGCRKIAYLQGVAAETGNAFRAELAHAGVCDRAELFMPDVEAMRERLPALLRNGEIDGIASDGGDERLETLFSILAAHRHSNLEILVDYVPRQSWCFKKRVTSKMFLNVMPLKEIGAVAAECLFKAKGRSAWHVKPHLLLPRIVKFSDEVRA